MEEFFPFLAGLAYMAYRIYDNFKKEQEQAKKRNIAQRFPEDIEHSGYQELDETESGYVPEKNTTYIPEKYHEPKYEPMQYEPVRQVVYKEPAHEEVRSVIPKTLELHNPEASRRKVRMAKTLDKPIFHAEDQEDVSGIDFDFRDAIVKEAILNRPQY